MPLLTPIPAPAPSLFAVRAEASALEADAAPALAIETAQTRTKTGADLVPYIAPGPSLPEPASLLALGLGGVALLRRRRLNG